MFVTSRKERVDNGDIKIVYTPTDDMIADILTKPLQGNKFRILRQLLLNWNFGIRVCCEYAYLLTISDPRYIPDQFPSMHGNDEDLQDAPLTRPNHRLKTS